MTMSLSKKVFTDPKYFLAYGLGSGLAPKAPGTAGSIVGVILWMPLVYLPLWNYLMTVMVIIFLGIYVSEAVSKEIGEADPSGIVIDEIAGVLITLFLLPEGWYWVIAGFAVFRFFDIIKPWPISWCDINIKGGLGIMLDDILAGILAFAVIQLGAFALSGIS